MKQIVIALLAIVAVQNAGAGTVGEYLKTKRAAEVYPATANSLKGYVAGLGNGMFWANSALAAQGETKLFCPPPKMILNVDNYFSILDREVAKSTTLDTDDIGMLLLYGLTVTFPCR